MDDDRSTRNSNSAAFAYGRRVADLVGSGTSTTRASIACRRIVWVYIPIGSSHVIAGDQGRFHII
jgi:hypothetical protein